MYDEPDIQHNSSTNTTEMTENGEISAFEGVAQSQAQCLPKLLALIMTVKTLLKITFVGIAHLAATLFVLTLLRTNVSLSIMDVTNAPTVANKHSLVEKLSASPCSLRWSGMSRACSSS